MNCIICLINVLTCVIVQSPFDNVLFPISFFCFSFFAKTNLFDNCSCFLFLKIKINFPKFTQNCRNYKKQFLLFRFSPSFSFSSLGLLTHYLLHLFSPSIISVLHRSSSLHPLDKISLHPYHPLGAIVLPPHYCVQRPRFVGTQQMFRFWRIKALNSSPFFVGSGTYQIIDFMFNFL